MMFPFITEDDVKTLEDYALPKEYEINFETGQLTGRVVEGVEAVKVWAWIALHTPRYRYYIYSWDYGQEYEDLIGKGYSTEYIAMEMKRMTEECLTVNPWITGIENFSCAKEEEKVTVSFTMLTSLGDAEVETDV